MLLQATSKVTCHSRQKPTALCGAVQPGSGPAAGRGVLHRQQVPPPGRGHSGPLLRLSLVLSWTTAHLMILL